MKNARLKNNYFLILHKLLKIFKKIFLTTKIFYFDINIKIENLIRLYK